MEASSASTSDLPESIFFTARKARIRSSNQDASSSSPPATSSCEFYSARIHSIVERTSELKMSQEDAEIEASKDHWTVVEPSYFSAATTIGTESSSSASGRWSETMTEGERLELYEENLQEVRRLQEANPDSQLFRIGDDGLVMGKKIAEGGQGEIYDAGLSCGENSMWYDDNYGKEIHFPVVWKVFKAGYRVSDLQKQWPLAFLHKHQYLIETGRNCNPMVCGRLLEDGRFAFEMLRFWGDLRKLLDMRMQVNGNQQPPFMMPDGNYHECCMLRIIWQIAQGMRSLHEGDVVHRDLKAANVLCTSDEYVEGVLEDRRYALVGPQLDPINLTHDLVCCITDYECSIGVVGTAYWRAPEILQALKNRSVNTAPNLFTPKSDVYSFAMTCYEVLTGLVPFEEVGSCSGEALVDEVLGGRRPTLPSHLQSWMVELMNKCWHMDPLERPTFREINDLLEGNFDNNQSYKKISTCFELHNYG